MQVIYEAIRTEYKKCKSNNKGADLCLLCAGCYIVQILILRQILITAIFASGEH